MPETADAVDLQAGAPGKRVDGPRERVKNAKASRQKPTLPKPKALRVQLAQLEKWIRSFNAEQQGRAVIHGYRDWPVINRKLIGDQKERLIFQLDGSLPDSTDEAPDLETLILKNPDWGGSGKYKIMVTEIGVPGCISMAIFKVEDSDYPPRVDPATLVIGHPDNKGYLEGLRASGIQIPGDDPEKYRQDKEQQQEMNIASVAFDHLAKQNDRLTEKLDEINERVDEAEPAEDPMTPVSQMVLETGLRMVEKQVDRVTQQSAVAYNPIEVAHSVMEMAEKMKGDGAGVLSVIQSMNAQNMQFMQGLLDEQRKESQYWRDRATQTAAAEPAKGIVDQMKDLAEFKAIARELFGTGRSEPRETPPAAPAGKNWMETLLENPQLPQLLNGALGFGVQLLQLLRAPQPDAVQPPAGSPEALRAALNGIQPAAAAAPGPTPEQQQQEQARQATMQFLQRIEKPFITHFFDLEQQGLNGYSFANRMHCEFVPDGQVTPQGRSEYETIRDRWTLKTFDALLRNYIPVWSMVQGNVPKYTEFLNQFMTYDQFINQENELDEKHAKISVVKN